MHGYIGIEYTSLQQGKRGKDAWAFGTDNLEAELALVGLRVKQITGDGNCFFRAISDQLEGKECLHGKLRQQVIRLFLIWKG